VRRCLRLALAPALTALCGVGLAVPAHASGTGSVTITALDRSGHKIQAPVWLVNPRTNASYTLASGKTRRLSNGLYGATVDIWQDGQTVQTLGSHSFTVKGDHVRLTFDARKGKAIVVTPSYANPRYFDWSADTCFGDTYNGGIDRMGGIASYVIPTTDKRVQFAVTSQWANTNTGPFYWAISNSHAGIPTRLTFSNAHTKFGKVLATVRRGRVKAPSTTLMMDPSGSNSCSGGTISWATFNAPRTVTAYLTAGIWNAYITYTGGYTSAGDTRVVAGRSYHLTFNRS
jgi:hypothetical protein